MFVELRRILPQLIWIHISAKMLYTIVKTSLQRQERHMHFDITMKGSSSITLIEIWTQFLALSTS